MQFANPFTRKGLWLRGNTHTHTTCSDGSLTPTEVALEYGRRGYDFLFLTDHRVRTETPKDLPKGAPLVIPAQEVDFAAGGTFFHVVCLGIKKSWPYRQYRNLNEVIRRAEKEGVSLIMAHPYWLGARSEIYVRSGNFLGVEVYNTVCDNIGKALSSVHWDDMLDAGKRVYGFAADDFHHLSKGIEGGWIMVKAARRTESAIMDAIRKGYFYSTQGPEIVNLGIRKQVVTVQCSPAARVNFIGDHFHGSVVKAKPGSTITEAAWEITNWLGATRYVRVEVIAPDGKMAWSNPIFLA